MKSISILLGLRAPLVAAVFALIVGVAGGALAGDKPVLDGKDGSFNRVKNAGAIIFGTSNDEPFNFQDPQTAQITGIDADMLAYIIQKLGIPQRKMFQDKFAGLIPALLSSRVDIIADAMTITAKRKQQIAFSDGWYQYGEVLVVPKGNPKNIHTLADLKKGYRAASYLGTVYQDWLNALAPEGAIISSYPTVPELLQDLKLGRLDAALVDAPVAAYVLSRQPDLAAAEEAVKGYKPRQLGVMGAGFRKEDVDLREAVNWALVEMRNEGADLAILKKWGLSEENRAPAP